MHMIIVVFACLGLLVGVLTGVTSSPITTTCTSPKTLVPTKIHPCNNVSHRILLILKSVELLASDRGPERKDC